MNDDTDVESDPEESPQPIMRTKKGDVYSFSMVTFEVRARASRQVSFLRSRLHRRS